MAGPWPKMLGIFVNNDGEFFLASNCHQDDGFLGKAESGDKLLVASDAWIATGLVRAIRESTFVIYDEEGKRVPLIDAFREVIADLMKKAYEAGLNGTLEP
ncbi:MAG TPA: hypothetical protein VMD74_03780 [Candidatus Methylomirabilis sp.]|nr:hypothetical protein [Candidatus Methylomirabilis sp.]